MTDQLASLVGSHICHDLISPIGAIGNGVELLTMSGGGPLSPELSLIADSVQSTNARIRFFRLAYGAASKNHLISRQDVMSILSAISQGGRLSYHWSPAEDVSRQDVRIVFLLIQCFETALPLGGHVDIELNHGRWTACGSGPRVTVDPALWRALTDPAQIADFKPSQIQFALVTHATADAGRTLSVQHEDAKITATF